MCTLCCAIRFSERVFFFCFVPEESSPWHIRCEYVCVLYLYIWYILVPIRSDFLCFCYALTYSFARSPSLSLDCRSHHPTRLSKPHHYEPRLIPQLGNKMLERWATGLNSKEKILRGNVRGVRWWRESEMGNESMIFSGVNRGGGVVCESRGVAKYIISLCMVFCFCFCIFPRDLGKMDLTAASSTGKRDRERNMKTCSDILALAFCASARLPRLYMCCFRL